MPRLFYCYRSIAQFFAEGDLRLNGWRGTLDSHGLFDSNRLAMTVDREYKNVIRIALVILHMQPVCNSCHVYPSDADAQFRTYIRKCASLDLKLIVVRHDW